MPTNLYGPNDNFDLENSHVIPALIRKKCYEAKKTNNDTLEVWGSGNVKKRFMHLMIAQAIIFLLKNFSESEHINIGTGLILR